MKTLAWTLLAASVVAVPMSEGPIALESRSTETDLTVTDATLSTAGLYAQYAGAAYCNSQDAVGDVITCDEDVCPTVTAAGATIVATMGSSDSDEITNMEGYVAVDPTNEAIIIAFRGTSTVRNVLADADFILTKCSKYLTTELSDDIGSSCKLHKGFGRAWAAVRDATLAGLEAAQAQQPSYTTVVITGHSLGAAVATLAAAELRISGVTCELYTYGSPRVGNSVLATYLTAQTGDTGVANHRFTHTDDPVPQLPYMLLGYRHTSPEYWINSDGTTNATTGLISYAVSDISVCLGIANADCNDASVPSFDGDAHQYYFVFITGCDTSTWQWRRSEPARA